MGRAFKIIESNFYLSSSCCMKMMLFTTKLRRMNYDALI